jgi:serine/threonine protein phosphatase PrpC
MLGVGPGATELPFVRRREQGDGVLLCTDGVSDQVTHEALASVFRDVLEPGAVAQGIVGLAARAGGDNATAVVVRRLS